MYRFFVNKKNKNYFELDKNTLDNIKTIRLRPSEHFYCVYNEEFYECKLEGKNALIIEKKDINNEFKNNVVLFASIINVKRFEWLIQKATELGVKEFYPLITKNTNIKYIDQVQNKIERFKEIIKNSSEQSFRNSMMKINDPIKFENAIKFEIKNKYLAHEKIDETTNICPNSFDTNVAFYIGPEGGFDISEIDQAKKEEINIIHLGKKILRAETASIFVLSRINEE